MVSPFFIVHRATERGLGSSNIFVKHQTKII